MKIVKKLFVILACATLFTACGSKESPNADLDLNSLTLEEITAKAKEEGRVNSLGMPDAWANWVGTWNDLKSVYGIDHLDTDMSSGEELAKFEAEKKDATGDIGDVGIAFGPLAVSKNLVLPYKTSYYDEVPDWARDKEGVGNWVIAYTGSMAFLSDKNSVKNPPKSWKELRDGDYTVTIGNVETANQAQFAVLAAAIAFGGDENNLEPAMDFYKELAEEGRLKVTEADIATLSSGEHQVALLFDFNALNYRDQIDKDRFDVTIPSDGSVMTGYTTIINKNAKNPYAAALAREYILSDAGQNNLARGYARPIRNVKLDEDAKAKLLPDELYKSVVPVKDEEAWDNVLEKLPGMWQEKVISFLK